MFHKIILDAIRFTKVSSHRQVYVNRYPKYDYMTVKFYANDREKIIDCAEIVYDACTGNNVPFDYRVKYSLKPEYGDNSIIIHLPLEYSV